jgi:Mce-associated membrane protein
LPTNALTNTVSTTSEEEQHDTPRDEQHDRPSVAEPVEVRDTAVDNEIDTEDEGSDAAGPPDYDTPTRPTWWFLTPPRLALLIGLVVMAALAAVISVLGVRAHHAHQAEQLRAQYLEVGRQGAVNLTTIDWRHPEADVQRILDSATGSFYDDFNQRSGPFVEVVKKVQSVSVGTITAAGLESSTDSGAQVLVAVNVETTTSQSPDRTPRAWRMRISVQKAGNDLKVSNVEFVP